MDDYGTTRVFAIGAPNDEPSRKEVDDLNALLKTGWHVKETHVTPLGWFVVVKKDGTL